MKNLMSQIYPKKGHLWLIYIQQANQTCHTPYNSCDMVRECYTVTLIRSLLYHLSFFYMQEHEQGFLSFREIAVI